MNVLPHFRSHSQRKRSRCTLFGYTIGTTVILAIVLLPLWVPASLFASTNIFSPTVSYVYSDGAAVSPVVSYQYYEWPGNGVLNLLSSPVVSCFYQFLGAPVFTTIQTNRTPTTNEITPTVLPPSTSSAQLEIFTSGAFKTNGNLNPNAMTIVLTHGWNDSPNSWASNMAATIVTNLGASAPNIVAWNWSNAAASPLLEPSLAGRNTPKQGIALGQALTNALGQSYFQKIHFIGHSFGTLVNAYAANFLEGSNWAGGDVSSAPWPGTNMLMTLFDEAEVGADKNFILNRGDLAALAASCVGLSNNYLTLPSSFYHPLPKKFAWADNYVSAFGLLYTNAVNVILTNGFPTDAHSPISWFNELIAFHGYPIQWYNETVQTNNSIIGFKWSVLWSAGDPAFTNPPSAGSVYVQTFKSSPWDLTLTNWNYGTNFQYQRLQEYWNGFGNSTAPLFVDNIPTTYAAQFVSNIITEYGTVIGQLLQVPNTPTPDFNAIINFASSPAPSAEPEFRAKPLGEPAGNGSTTNVPAYAWMQLVVPTNAVSMSFDYIIQGDWQSDSLAAAINGTNVLLFAGNTIQTNVTFSSGSIDVSGFAGETNELFIGIVGGTSTNAQMTVENLIFYIAAQAPSSILGDSCLQWISSGSAPLAGYGYSLFLPANSGNSYQLIGIYNVTSSTGTYTYTPTSSSVATIGFNDSLGGLGDLSVTFTTTNSGNFSTTLSNYPSAYQSGGFSFSSFNAPSSIAGKTVVCSIVSASSPFYTSGSYNIYIGASGTTYTTSIGDSGTCSYSLANRSTGKLQLTSVLIGSFVGYFGYTDALHGGFAATQSSTGGYQVGNFTQLDTNPPTVSITSPTAGQKWSNSVFNVTGTANDDTQVAQVYYQIFGAGWNSASSTNGWTNWSGNISLSTIGTNIIQAYSVDTSGHSSSIASQTVVYVATAVATVQTNGSGTISPNYNGQLLAIGNNYSMTATAGSGFAFVNWTGSLVTNNATVQFSMISNLTLTANFADVTKPTVAITSPTASQSWSNQVFIIRGTANDNVVVTNVFYQLNGSGWNPAPTTNNWTNWQSTVLLQPSNNVLQAYAVDGSGNLSTTSSVSFTYVVSDTLRVQTTGQGSISPNYSNAVLQIGKSFSMTATAATGFTFVNWGISTNWIGSVISNNATLGFVMQSNLTIQANFADTTRPTNTITAPIPGQRWSNLVFTVRGSATDNWQVANVQYQFNGLNWSNATTTNAWTNWYASLNLIPGTNAVAAYASDTTGNNSTTNSVNFQFVVTNQLQFSITGLGTITPTNTWLEIGRNYSITSAPASGFKFTNWIISTNWIGGVTVNSTNLLFMMESNLTVQANFIDTNNPTLNITNLSAGQRVSNVVFTLKGTASDNWQVSNVVCQINGGGWNLATNFNNWTNWSAGVTLAPGTNVVQAYATDTTGNNSTTNSVNFQYVVTNQLQVFTTGLGTISPNYSNAWLEVGRNYSVTSAPAAGFSFTNWTSSQGWSSNSVALTFMMASNLTLTANFIDTNKPGLSITNLIAGQRWSNLVFTVKGSATDNWQVASVQYQFNSLSWSNATTTNVWTNWYATLNLVPGTNAISAYATDNSGNNSTTSSVSFQYVVTNQMQIRSVGKGTIAPTNTWMEIGRNYSITSAPATGFVFTNWTVSTNWNGGATVTGTNLLFMMQSNLTLLATFNETSRPTLLITAPTSNQHMTNALANIIGTNSDNWGVSGVWYRLNSNVWNSATTTTNSYTNWAQMVTLLSGTNTVNAYAINLGGNYSLTNTVSFVSSNTFKLQLVFTNAQPMKTNGLVFNLQLSTGLNGHIQVSTNLMSFTNWVTLTNFVGSNATITFRDPAATNSSPRFYRAVIP